MDAEGGESCPCLRYLQRWLTQLQDTLVQNVEGWSDQGLEHGSQDILIGALVELRSLTVSIVFRSLGIASHPTSQAETSNVFNLRKGTHRENSDVNYDILLRVCNAKLNMWAEKWELRVEGKLDPSDRMSILI